MSLNYEDIEAIIEQKLQEPSLLTADDVLKLTLARRLNQCSEKTLGEALGGKHEPPLNFWGKR